MKYFFNYGKSQKQNRRYRSKATKKWEMHSVDFFFFNFHGKPSKSTETTISSFENCQEFALWFYLATFILTKNNSNKSNENIRHASHKLPEDPRRNQSW